jgi:predicted aspartyl protease
MAIHPLIAAAASVSTLAPAIASLPIAIAQQGAPEAAAVDVLSTRADAHDRMTVPVRIGAKGPFAFLIDTGAERTVLSRDVATRLGLAPSGQALIVGVAGEQQVDLVDVEEINLGRRSFYGLTAPLLDDAHIGADGIVGLDSLQGQRVLLDFDRNRMAIGDAEMLGGNGGFDIVVTARRRSGQLIMTNAIIDGVRTDVVIDTGSDTSIGNRALQKQLARRHKQQTTQLMSVTGQAITADLGLARELKFGSVTISNTMIAFADAPPFERLDMVKRPALLLGMDQLRLFHRVAIDFAARRIMFDLPDNVLL